MHYSKGLILVLFAIMCFGYSGIGLEYGASQGHKVDTVSNISVIRGHRVSKHKCPGGVNRSNLIEISPIEVICNRNRDHFTQVRPSSKENLVSIKCQSFRCGSSHDFKLATLNARSIKAHLDIIKQISIEDNLQVLALTETWLSDNNEYISREVCPHGYTILRADRMDRKGGGVAILCNSALNPRIIQSKRYGSFEHLMVSLRSKGKDLRVLVLYRPPSSSNTEFIEEFSSMLEETVLDGHPILITGDFNIHWDADNNTSTKRFRDALYAF